MNKGERTRQHILEQGMRFGSRYGLAELSIGEMAKRSELSRGGVMAHFANKRDMQLAILEYSEQRFMETVLKPAKDEQSMRYLEKVLSLWVDWTHRALDDEHTTCPFIKAIVDYQHREDCPVRQRAFAMQQNLLSFLAHRIKRCQQDGSIQDSLDAEACAYQIYSLYLGHALARHSLPEQAQDFFKQALFNTFGGFR